MGDYLCQVLEAIFRDTFCTVKQKNMKKEKIFSKGIEKYT